MERQRREDLEQGTSRATAVAETRTIVEEFLQKKLLVSEMIRWASQTRFRRLDGLFARTTLLGSWGWS